MRREKRERRKKMDSMRKGIYILPNLFTSASLFCGFFSLLRTLQEDFYTAGTIDSTVADNLARAQMLYVGQYCDEGPLFFGVTSQVIL